ncbi:MAG: cystathionine gamma-synthase family protein [Thermoproteus sp. AZ2]|jgi:cystathionine gamma-synthase|uniref:Cystathionine gamma-synthase family protein n=1 Tax=Thermoproteus sp. AZ2 TaxID=1609232 RepID=A0ACC6V0I8_9CREN|nr:MAG: cystathionine gamma-synthase [Thermoproteus sp. AZ2]
MRKRTAAIRGHEWRDEYGSPIPPVYLTAIFEQIGEARKSDRGLDLKYAREENPTVRAFERAVAKVEGGGDALAFNSGMAAISALAIYLLASGDGLLTTKEAYGATLRLFGELSNKYGIKLRKVFPDTEAVVEALKEKPKVLFVETITNPTLRVLDMPEVLKAAKDVGAIAVVDNTFATPALFNPMAHGADYVVHSATKYIAGHNDVVGGVVVTKEVDSGLWTYRAMLGGIMQPFEAFLCARGLKTMHLRVKEQSASALAVAEFLAEHSKVREVIYPGLPTHPHYDVARKLFGGSYGGVVSFRVKGGRAEVEKFLSSLKLITPSPSLGGAETIATYPILSAASPIPPEDREELGITEDLIRLSVGLEDVEDIIEDLDHALRSIG